MNCPACKEARHFVTLKIEPLEGAWEFRQPGARFIVRAETSTRAHVVERITDTYERKRLTFRKAGAADRAREVAQLLNDAYRSAYTLGRFESVRQGELWGIQPASKERTA